MLVDNIPRSADEIDRHQGQQKAVADALEATRAKIEENKRDHEKWLAERERREKMSREIEEQEERKRQQDEYMRQVRPEVGAVNGAVNSAVTVCCNKKNRDILQQVLTAGITAAITA